MSETTKTADTNRKTTEAAGRAGHATVEAVGKASRDTIDEAARAAHNGAGHAKQAVHAVTDVVTETADAATTLSSKVAEQSREVIWTAARTAAGVSSRVADISFGRSHNLLNSTVQALMSIATRPSALPSVCMRCFPATSRSDAASSRSSTRGWKLSTTPWKTQRISRRICCGRRIWSNWPKCSGIFISARSITRSNPAAACLNWLAAPRRKPCARCKPTRIEPTHPAYAQSDPPVPPGDPPSPPDPDEPSQSKSRRSRYPFRAIRPGTVAGNNGLS